MLLIWGSESPSRQRRRRIKKAIIRRVRSPKSTVGRQIPSGRVYPDRDFTISDQNNNKVKHDNTTLRKNQSNATGNGGKTRFPYVA